MMERCKSAELDGYTYDCMTHPTLRKRKFGCLSGISKAGNTWFTLAQESKLERLVLTHSTVEIPTLIGPFSCKLQAVKLSGSQNFVELAQKLQLDLSLIRDFDLNLPSDYAKSS